jgi:hypothetical protein
MTGILEQKSEIEKFKVEYKMMSKIDFDLTKIVIVEEELINEDCELQFLM